MNPLRTQIKFFFNNPSEIDLASFAPVFQRWIQQKTLEGQLIDVADYRHVFQGPGVVLIGYDSDYTIENHEGRLGLLYTRKRQVDPDLQSQLRAAFRLALAACQALEAERSFKPALQFRGDEVEIRFADRLQLPNKPESYDLVKDDLRAVLDDLFGADVAYALPVKQDARYLFTVNVRADDEVSISSLLRHASVVK